MGVHSQFNNNKRRKSKCPKQRKKLQQAVDKKDEKSVMIEGVELLSKEQLKKLAKNPTNNIRPSGKRKRKMLKRLKHSQREKNAMDVEAGPSTSQSTSKAVESDEEMEAMDEDMSSN